MEILQKTKIKGARIYEVGIKRERKHCDFGINGKKEQGSGDSKRKASSMLCEKKEGEPGLEQILNFRLVLCS